MSIDLAKLPENITQDMTGLVGECHFQLFEQPRQVIAQTTRVLSAEDAQTIAECEDRLAGFLATYGTTDAIIDNTPDWQQAQADYTTILDLLDFESMNMGQRAV